MKKASLAMLAMMLIIQVLFSPLTIFAENDPLSTPPAASEDAGSELEHSDADAQEGTEDGETSTEEGTGEEATSEEGTEDGELAVPLGAELLSVADMSADVQMEFLGLTLNGRTIASADDLLNYTGPSPKNGDAVQLAYRFIIEGASQDYSAGSSFSFPLPANMIEEFNPGTFSGTYSKGEEGTPDWFAYNYVYDSAAKTVTVTLESGLEEARQEVINFTFYAKFGNFADETELEQNLIIPVNGGATTTLPFQFAPTANGSLITKNAGPIIRSSDGKVTIPWTVWVNTAGKKLTGAELSDATDGKHGLTGSITVEQYLVGLNGINTAAPGTAIATTTETEFPIELSDGYYAYKITYNTEVTANPENSNETYSNTATLTGDGIPANTRAQASQSVQYGPSLEKTRTGDKYESNWSIKYNWLGQTIDADDAVLTDVMTYSRAQTGTHEIDYTSFKVYRVTLSADGQQAASKTPLIENTDYVLIKNPVSATPKRNGFEIDFSNDATAGKVTAAYLIEYDTSLDAEFVTSANSGTITNTVSRGDGGSVTATLELTPGIFTKSRGAIDYVNKTIEWTLTIRAEQELHNFIIEDEFSANNNAGNTLNHKLVQWSSSDTDLFKFSGLPSGVSASPTKKDGSSPSAADDENFKIEFLSTIPRTTDNEPTTVTIRYKTEFEIKPNGEVATAYINTAKATWSDSASGTYEATASASYEPSTVTRNNGYKKGSVNNNTQVFSWSVGVNVNKQDINGATLTDTLGAGHYIPVPSGKTLKDQITITRLNLTSEEGTKNSQPQLHTDRWSVTQTTDSDDKVIGFVITFSGLNSSENNQAYLIEYNTKDSDDIYGQSTGNARNYLNAATLATPGDGDYDYSTTVTISNKANELITKAAQVVPNDDLIHWTITVNASNSKIGNITLKDTPSSNQKVLLDTFKKQEIKLDSGGTSRNVGSSINIDSDEILVDEEDGSFSINLGNLDGKGYVITYSTFFLGDGNTGEQVSNEATIGYAGASAGNTSDEGQDSKQFKYSGSDSDASSTKGTLQIQKYGLNPLTGATETLGGVEFQLWNKTGTIKLYEGVTNAEGIVAFENVRYGKYVLREFNQPAGYLPPSPIDITMRADIDVSIADGKPFIVNNIEEVDLAGACPTYTLTIYNVNGQVVAGQEINLVDGNNNIVYTGTTDGSGQLTDINRPGTGGKSVQAGLYTVTNASGTELGKVTVSYETGNCEGQIQPLPACPLFTINVVDDQGNPRENVEVTLTNADNTYSVTRVTNEDGEITVPSTTPAGTYKLYENQQLLGTVEISYLDDCEATLDVARVCETFVLTVNDEDGKPKANATVIIKDKDNPNNTVPQPSVQTDAAGKVSITGLQPGTYVVEVGGKVYGEFEVGTDCAATVQPLPACPTFILTVKDEDGLVEEGTELIITNTSTNASVEATVGSNGQVSFASPTTLGDYELAPGEYSVVIGGTGSYAGKTLGTFNVSYTEDCRAEVERPRGCTTFVITVIAPNGTTPKANTPVIVVDAAGAEMLYTTNADGKITLPTTQEPGEVTVYERNSDGSLGEELGKVYVSYKDDCIATVIKNACPTFTLKVNNGDSTPFSSGVEINIVDENEEIVDTGVTDVNGQIVFNDKSKLQQGEKYTVVVSKSGVELGEITISYIDEICGVAVQTPANACPTVNITVNDENGQPRPDVNVTLKDAANAVVTSATTNAEGAFTVPSNTPAGTYKLYEDKQFIGEVVISYQDGNCEAELNAQDIARVCETFTLTVNDEDGKTRANASVTIVNKASELQVAAVTTNEDGLATITNLEPGDYEVYDNDRKLGEFSVATDCEATVQPPIGCPTFVVTLHDEDGLVAAGTEVTIKNVATEQTIVRQVDGNGKVSFLSSLSNAPAGLYEATITSGSETGKVLGTFTVTYTADCEAEVVKPRVCTVFEITVIAPDGTTPKSNSRVVVIDGTDNEIYNGSTDENGKIALPQNHAIGPVTVYEVNGDGTIGEELDQVYITYKNDCQGIVIKNACPVFTLTVNNSDLEAVSAGVKVTIVDQAGDIVEAGVTDVNGQIIFNDKAKLQQGETYTVLNESGKELGQITVSYIDEICEAAVQVPINACPVFTLSVQNVNGLPREGVAVEIRTNTGLTATVVATGTTDIEGKVYIPYTIEPGVYYVFEGSAYMGAIAVNENCTALVKPYVWPDPPVEPEPTPSETPEPTPSETPEPTPSETPDPTPSETPEPTPSETPGPSPTPAPEKPKTPELEEIINKIPTIPGVKEKPSKPNEPGTKYDIPDVPKTIEELKKDPKKVEKVTKDLKDFIAKYEKLSAEEKLIVDELVDVDKLRGILSQLPTVPGGQPEAGSGKPGQSNELPKTGDTISLMIWLFIGSAALIILMLQLGKRRIEKQ